MLVPMDIMEFWHSREWTEAESYNHNREGARMTVADIHLA